MNTLEQASFITIRVNDNIANKPFAVPSYQWGYVGSEKQKEQFVDVLKRDLSFETILLYQDEKENKYPFIDGLQRCATIFKFINKPAPFFNEDDIEKIFQYNWQKLQVFPITLISQILLKII